MSQKELSEREIACLTLVAHNHTSKEIARLLDISPHTVDQRMRSAQRKLGVTSRSEAARLFMASQGDGANLYQPLIYQGSAYQAPFQFEKEAVSLPSEAISSDQGDFATVHDSMALFSGHVQREQNQSRLASVWIASDTKGVPNTLGSMERSIAIIGIALLAALVFGLLLNGLLGLGSMV
jgi:DNA-binding CsgD family transcriptional regulator